MAQTVGVPTFYIDSFVLYNALKLGSSDFPIFDLNPSSQYLSVGSGSIDHPHQFIYNFTTPMYNIHYIAVLGHNLGDNKHLWQQFRSVDENGDMVATDFDFQDSPTSEVNYGSSSIGITHNGFSIRTFTDAGGNTGSVDEIKFYGNSVEHDIKIGCISMGSIYEMKNAPNLSLKIGREYGGTKEFTTYNGSSMSNTMWNKPPKWGDLGAWELGNSNPALSRSGRRTWDLTFSYIDDGDLWGSNQSIGIHAEQDGWDTFYPTPSGSSSDYDTDDIDTADGQMVGFNYNLLTDDNFFSQVWHKTLGGTLPFIFQPDSNNFNPDQFAIVKSVKNSLKAKQVAPNLYDISISLEEVW